MSISQPLAWLLSQLAKPWSQESMRQFPFWQVAVASSSSQALLQEPQLLTSVLRLTSQPLEGSPSQSENPAWQEPIWQPPSVQIGLALGRLQAMPQPPQLLTSDWMLDS